MPYQYGEFAASAWRSGRCRRMPLNARIAVAASGMPTWTWSAAVGVRVMSPRSIATIAS
jgi:hypothetical protein